VALADRFQALDSLCNASRFLETFCKSPQSLGQRIHHPQKPPPTTTTTPRNSISPSHLYCNNIPPKEENYSKKIALHSLCNISSLFSKMAEMGGDILASESTEIQRKKQILMCKAELTTQFCRVRVLGLEMVLELRTAVSWFHLILAIEES
jgi:hypothetical protein